MAVFPSEEWLEQFVEKINASSEYADAAATWEGDLVFVYEKEPDKGVDEDVYAWLDLWHGKCRDAARLEGPDDPKAKSAKFTISAPYSRWKSVVKKELDPVKGMMQGKIKVKGDLPTIVRYVKASNVLVDLTSQVETEFIDEVPSA
ncbi:MAG TPA: SCP2 sterol-binding domain-containing protein [Frankiaceae bacterium]|jgi:putative sterol carrier protein|nr:SCP2 sterol-binding domain-containing protein [Frankiaceae bacterium]